jgi:hypothetical protein
MTESKFDLLGLVADSRAAAEAILSAPMVDPAAPPEYLRRSWADAEKERRIMAVLDVWRGLRDAFDELTGPELNGGEYDCKKQTV